jgi:DNA-binding MarR family transcriptional regulator
MATVVKSQNKAAVSNRRTGQPSRPYLLDEQVGFILRRAHQRASAIFARHFKDANLSPVQFSALAKIQEQGHISQNHLGRLIYMDPATTMGVVNRLAARDLVRRMNDSSDRRRTLLSITSMGLKTLEECEDMGFRVTAETLEPLNEAERTIFLELLARLT